MHANCKSSTGSAPAPPALYSWPLRALPPAVALGGMSAVPVTGLVPARAVTDSIISGSAGCP